MKKGRRRKMGEGVGEERWGKGKGESDGRERKGKKGRKGRGGKGKEG